MIESIKAKVESGKYYFTFHALERCVERSISPQEIAQAIFTGEIIEYYPEDKYGASCLIWGYTEKGRILHVQSSVEPVWVITSYDPTLTPEDWEDNYRKRKSKK
jgi:hypothetical protein